MKYSGHIFNIYFLSYFYIRLKKKQIIKCLQQIINFFIFNESVINLCLIFRKKKLPRIRQYTYKLWKADQRDDFPTTRVLHGV